MRRREDRRSVGPACACGFLPGFVRAMPPAARGFSVRLGWTGDRNCTSGRCDTLLVLAACLRRRGKSVGDPTTRGVYISR
eukprot:6203924-Pleurochrysis_carterae.AAC.1